MSIIKQTIKQMQELSKPFNISLFSDNTINLGDLFFAFSNQIPCWIRKNEIDCKKADEWFSKKYSDVIKESFYKMTYTGSKMTWKSSYYFLFDDLLVNFDTEIEAVRFLFRNTDEAAVNEVIASVDKFRRKIGRKPEISLVVNKSWGIDTETMTIARQKLSIDENYNDNLKPVHQTITKRLSNKNDKGLVLLYGKAGTGKTSYIRYLITQIKKNFIFIPPHLAKEIVNPQLISLLTDHPNSIFVIEDAENIISDRNKNENSPVTTLLNITDGLLSDCLNVQIICTFNTNLSNIDQALLRKGRLIAKYEFMELEVGKAQTLSNKLGFTAIIDKSMTLAAIYHQDEEDYQNVEKRNTIGFANKL